MDNIEKLSIEHSNKYDDCPLSIQEIAKDSFIAGATINLEQEKIKAQIEILNKFKSKLDSNDTLSNLLIKEFDIEIELLESKLY